jgi:hypothetical protein
MTGGGDAILRRGRDVLAPGDLTVIVGMDVDEARGHELALGVDFLLALARDAADFGNATPCYRDIRFEQFAAESVGDAATVDHEVWVIGHAFHPALNFVAAS